MAYYMERAPASVQNPFSSFYEDIRRFNESYFVKDLGQRDKDHYLFRAIVDLQKATITTANQTQWGGPFSSTSQHPFGHTPKNSWDSGYASRSSHQPTTPNLNTGGLHPNNFNPGFSPPRTPSSDRESNRSSAQFSELSAKIGVYEKKFEKYQNDLRSERQEHEQTKQALQGTQHALRDTQHQLTQVTDTRKTIEDLHVEAINLYEQRQHYGDAIRHLEKLCTLKLDEADTCYREGNQDAEKKADYAAVDYEQRKGKMLRLNRQYEEAVDVFQRVLTRRKELLGANHLTSYKESRDAQLQLCQTLRKLRQDPKTIQAEEMYEKHAILTRVEGKNDISREWAFRNAIGLAGALVERRAYRYAWQKLKLVWDERSYCPASYKDELTTDVLDTIAVLERRLEPEPLTEALKIICQDDPAEVPSQIVPRYIQLARLLHQSGKKEDNEKAITYLQDAWSQRSLLGIADEREVLWALALAHASLDHWANVKKHLDDLKKYDNAEGTPSPDMIKALKARLQLGTNDVAAADATATTLWEKYGVVNVLQSSVSLHQVDTLIKALSKQKNKDKFAEAKKVWDEVYDSARKGQMEKEEMRLFAKTGMAFAEEWEVCRKKYVKNLTGPGKVREGCREMEAWAAAL